MSNEIVFVSDLDNDVLVSSRMIAEKFEKEHRNVLASIRELVAQLDSEDTEGSDFGLLKIQQSSYLNEQGKRMPEFRLNRDAFSILAMGFTGQKALKWKVLFLGAFDEALGSVAKLREELSRNEQVILQLQAAKKKRTSESYLLVAHEEPCFEGHIPKVTYERVPASEISEEKRKEILTAHNAKTVAGIIKRTIEEVGVRVAFEAFYNVFREFLPKG
jgi:Rha family phage regulatory protein